MTPGHQYPFEGPPFLFYLESAFSLASHLMQGLQILPFEEDSPPTPIRIPYHLSRHLVVVLVLAVLVLILALEVLTRGY